MKTIKLTRGLEALIDDGDHAWASGFNWHAAPRGNPPRQRFVAARATRAGGRQRVISLASEVYGPVPDGHMLTYANGNSLDCRRQNLVARPKTLVARAQA